MRRAQGVDVMAATTLGDKLDEAFFDAAGERLKLIANFGAGVDHIDVAAANARGIIVTNTPSVLAEDAADMAMALMLAVPRRLVEGVEALKANAFEGWSPTWMLGRRVRGKKLGVIGLGRVGEAIARRARAFGLSIHYHNRNRINPHIEDGLDATYWESLDQMLAPCGHCFRELPAYAGDLPSIVAQASRIAAIPRLRGEYFSRRNRR